MEKAPRSQVEPFILFATPRSPFARRIRLALGLRTVPHQVRLTNVMDPSPEFLATNPLGLVPVLFDPEIREWVADSDTQLDLLDESPILARMAVEPIWPIRAGIRARVRVRSRWATGIMTALVAHFLERSRSDGGASDVLLEHRGAIVATLNHIAHDLAKREELWVQDSIPTQAGWDLGTALEYLELRLPDLDWKKEWPVLVGLLGLCRRNPVFQETTPPPA